MYSTELKTDRPGRALFIETAAPEISDANTVYVCDVGVDFLDEGVYVNTLELLEAVAKASGYKVTVEYTPPAPERVTVVYGE